MTVPLPTVPLPTVPPPFALLAELTHRCPLQCPYCANPLALERVAHELDTAGWMRVLDEAAELGVLQVHFSGGEPCLRRDLPELVRHAAALGLYSNLITSGVVPSGPTLAELAGCGLDHVQLSFQDVEAGEADRLAGMRGAHARKLEVARLADAAGLPLTTNFVVHRQNLERLPAMLALGASLGASRIEIAHVQYYGWALANRDALMPSRAQLDAATAEVEAARARHGGALLIDYVAPDYHAALPKACMGGWARQVINVTPSGRALPCHAAETIPGVAFPSVREQSLGAIWTEAPLFTMFRGTHWMQEPCRSCDRREVDWGGCRCQALALTGDAAATDPACALSPRHELMAAAVARAERVEGALIYRRMGSVPGLQSA